MPADFPGYGDLRYGVSFLEQGTSPRGGSPLPDGTARKNSERAPSLPIL